MEAIKNQVVKYQGQLFPIMDALINGLNLMVHIYISWMITKNEYGVLNAVFSFITLIMVVGVSLQTYVAKEVSDPTWEDIRFPSLLYYTRGILFKMSLLLILTAPFIKKLLRVDYGILLLVLLIFITNAHLSIYRGVYQGKKMFLLLSRSFYIDAIIKLMSIVTLLFIYQDKVFAIIGVLLGLIGALLADQRQLSFSIKGHNVDLKINKTFKNVFSANFFYFYLTTLTLIMINYHLPSASGVFAVSIKYCQIYMHVGFSIITVLVPVLSRHKYNLDNFKKWVNKIFLLCLLGGVMALTFYQTLFPQTIVWIFGDAYSRAKDIIFLQALSYFAFVIASYFVTMNIILERKSYLKYMVLSSVLLTIGLQVFNQSIYQFVYVELSVFIGLAIMITTEFYLKGGEDHD